jgi:hypothetical protein
MRLTEKLSLKYRLFLATGLIGLISLATPGLALEFITDNADTTACVQNPPKSWSESGFGNNYNGSKLYSTRGDGSKSVTFTTKLPKGRYSVKAWVNPSQYTSDAHYLIVHSRGTTAVVRSQYMRVGDWSIDLGIYDFDQEGKVIVTNEFTSPENYVVADAVRYVEISTTEIVWSSNSPAEALSLSTSMEKPVLVYFSTGKSTECQQLESESFRDPTLVKMMENFITVKIKAEENPEPLRHYNVYRVPTILILNRNGAEKFRTEGYKNSNDLIRELNTVLSMVNNDQRQ